MNVADAMTALEARGRDIAQRLLAAGFSEEETRAIGYLLGEDGNCVETTPRRSPRTWRQSVRRYSDFVHPFECFLLPEIRLPATMAGVEMVLQERGANPSPGPK